MTTKRQRSKEPPTCWAVFEVGIEYEAAITMLWCELPLDHEGPHQKTVKWEMVNESPIEV